MIVKRELVNEADFTAEVNYMMMIDRMLKKAPIARTTVDNPFYTVTVNAIYMKKPLFENFPRVRKPYNQNQERRKVTAAITRALVTTNEVPNH